MTSPKTVLRDRSEPWMLTICIISVFLALLEFFTKTGRIERILAIPPSEIFTQLLVMLQTEVLRMHLFISAYRVLVTFVIATTIALVVSLALWRFPLLRDTYIPVLGAVFGTPIVLLYLIFVVIFGRGTAAIVAIAVPVGAIPIIVNSTDALASVNEGYTRVSESFNAGSVETITKVIIPAAAPGIFSGIRIGFSYMLTVVIAVEFLLVTEGLGGLISDAYLRFNTTNIYVGITFVIFLVVTGIFIFRRIEQVIGR